MLQRGRKFLRVWRRRSVRDAAAIAGLCLVTFIVAAAFDIFAQTYDFIKNYEAYELDELIVVAIVLGFLTVIYAQRRVPELKLEIRKHLERNFGKTVLAVIFAGAGGIGAACSDELVLQGSATFSMALAQPYAKAVEAQTGRHLEIITNKSNLGLLALFEYKADLAMISTTLASEVKILRRSNADLPFQRLRAFEIARTRAAFVIHPSNPVRNARLEDIRKILTGEIFNWRQLGGPDLPIRVVAVREGGGALASVEAKLLGGAYISAPDMIRVQVGTQTVKVVGQEPGAFGISLLAIVKASSAVELVTDETIEQVLNLVSLDEPSPNAIAVIDAFRQMAKKGN